MTAAAFNRLFRWVRLVLPALAVAFAVSGVSSVARANVIEINNQELAPQGQPDSVDLFDFVYEDGGDIEIKTANGYKGGAEGTFDPLMFLLDSEGTIVAADNNSGGSFEAKLAGYLGAGQYTVAVLRNSGQSLAYYQAAVDAAISSSSAFRGNQIGTYDLIITAAGQVTLGGASVAVPELSTRGSMTSLLLLAGALAIGTGGRRRCKLVTG